LNLLILLYNIELTSLIPIGSLFGLSVYGKVGGELSESCGIPASTYQPSQTA